MDEFEELKPQKTPIEMERWNIKDLNIYINKLNIEIEKVKLILSKKKEANDSAKALFEE